MRPKTLSICVWLVLFACDRPDGDARPPSPESRARGRELYLAHCALCHGEKADGQGIRREGLSGKPADFTSAAWRARVTPRSVVAAIRGGVPGTSMPAWRTLSDDEIEDLASFVLSVSAR